MNIIVSTNLFISLDCISVGFTVSVKLILWCHCVRPIIGGWITFYRFNVLLVALKSLEMKLCPRTALKCYRLMVRLKMVKKHPTGTSFKTSIAFLSNTE